MSCSLNFLYDAIGLSKQAVHGQINRYMSIKEMECQVLKLVRKIRSDHPTMGVREMYFLMNPGSMGRDIFEALCRDNGLTIKPIKNYHKTTDSSGVERFDNLINGLDIEAPNQVWQSDITYYRIENKFYYITLIQDAFTKIIVGYSVSKRLKTNQTTIPSLSMAFRNAKKAVLDGLIFHSDGGGQYYSVEFLKLIKSRNLISSMGKDCYENAMAESLNGVIKNKYLYHRSINNFKELEYEVDRTVQLYNFKKPHSSLNRLTPYQFLNNYLSLENQTNASIEKSTDANSCKKEASSLFLTDQTNTNNKNVTAANRVIT